MSVNSRRTWCRFVHRILHPWSFTDMRVGLKGGGWQRGRQGKLDYGGASYTRPSSIDPGTRACLTTTPIVYETQLSKHTFVTYNSYCDTQPDPRCSEKMVSKMRLCSSLLRLVQSLQSYGASPHFQSMHVGRSPRLQICVFVHEVLPACRLSRPPHRLQRPPHVPHGSRRTRSPHPDHPRCLWKPELVLNPSRKRSFSVARDVLVQLTP